MKTEDQIKQHIIDIAEYIDKSNEYTDDYNESRIASLEWVLDDGIDCAMGNYVAKSMAHQAVLDEVLSEWRSWYEIHDDDGIWLDLIDILKKYFS